MRIFQVLVALLAASTQLNAQSVGGHVFITLGSGDAQLVRGTEVLLMCGTVTATAQTDSSIAALRRVGTAVRQGLSQFFRNDNAPEAISQVAGASAYAKAFLPRLADATYSQFATGQVAATRTSFEGQYRFDEITSGNYFIVARHKTNSNDVLWRVPVTIRSGAQTIDLSNVNLVDLRAVLAISDAEDAQRWADQQISRFFSDQRTAMLQTQLNLAGQASTASIPENLLKPLRCGS